MVRQDAVTDRLNEIRRLLRSMDSRNRLRLIGHLALCAVYRLTRKRPISRTRLEVSGIAYDLTVANGELRIVHDTSVEKIYMQRPDFIPRNGALCVDLGANIGSASLAWTRAMAGGRIYAVEPHPVTYAALLRNIAINRVDDVIQPFQAAIGAQSGQLELFISDLGSMAMRPGVARIPGRRVTVECLTMDDFVRKEKIAAIDVLKVDVEGFEGQVLAGAREALKRTVRVVLEFHSRDLFHECAQRMTQAGFTVDVRDTLMFCSRPRSSREPGCNG